MRVRNLLPSLLGEVQNIPFMWQGYFAEKSFHIFLAKIQTTQMGSDPNQGIVLLLFLETESHCIAQVALDLQQSSRVLGL